MSLWKYYHDIGKFNELIPDRQQEIIDAILTVEYITAWNYPSMLATLIEKVSTDELAIKLLDNYLSNATYLDTDSSYKAIQNAYIRCKDKDIIKKIIKNCKLSPAHRALLGMKDLTFAEEDMGLRSLSTVKYAPNMIYENKYAPSKEAIKNLPPVMRLNMFETLLENNNIAYNVFANFTDPEDFKAMLFGAVLRHRGRVEIIWEKFNEIKNYGEEATIVISYTCANCGKFDISIKSVRARTETGLNKTQLGRHLRNKDCPLCGAWGDNVSKSFRCSEE